MDKTAGIPTSMGAVFLLVGCLAPWTWVRVGIGALAGLLLALETGAFTGDTGEAEDYGDGI